jgi:hypothetical protein
MKTTQILYDCLFQCSLYVITTGCLEKKSRIILEVYFYEQIVVSRGRESRSQVSRQQTVRRLWSQVPVYKAIYQFVPCGERQLILFREAITVDFKYHTKHLSTLCNKIHFC